jgi:FMN phosphatase YigB (HAD superfamily)
MTKPILFIDFYKTLNHDAYWRSLLPEELQEVQGFLFHSGTTLVDDWMRGDYTAEQINKILSDNLKISYGRLWNTFVADCESMTIPITTLETINYLRKKYYIILLTDNMDNFTRFTCPALNLNNYFNAISNSYDQRLLKTDNDGEIFLKYVKEQNANIKDCILLDDSQKIYDTFTNLGGTAHLITPEKDIAYHLQKLI